MRDGYFAPESAIRRIGRESVLMAGGGRALLMQAAHPLVAAGIVEHSGYRDEPWRRLARTMTALYTVVYGSKADADRVGAHVRAVHSRVRGRDYDALDPHLLLWVHSTLVDTGLVMYERFVGPLPSHDREAFYRDMKVVARVFGVPAGVIPSTLGDFHEYQRERLESGEIAVGAAARDVAATVLDPPAPAALRPALALVELVTVGLLPPEIRAAYGFPWSARRERVLAASAASIRRLFLPLVPDAVRVVAPEAPGNGRGGLPLRVMEAFAANGRRPGWRRGRRGSRRGRGRRRPAASRTSRGRDPAPASRTG